METEAGLIKKLEDEIIKRFGYRGEDAETYEKDLRMELQEWITAHFDNIEIKVKEEYQNYKEERTVILQNGSLTKKEDFRKIVIENIIPLAIKHTECFYGKNGLDNIEKVLNYSQSSIEFLVPIVKELEENSKKYILEKYPKFQEYIQENNKQAGDKSNDENSSDPYTIVEKLNNDARELMKKLKESNDPTERRNIKEEIVEIQKLINEIYDAEIKAIPEPTQQITE